MAVAERKTAAETLTLRLDRKLKDNFVSLASEENRAASEVLRDLMADYIKRERRKRFEAEAHRQSLLASSSFDEEEVMKWIENVSDTEGWR